MSTGGDPVKFWAKQTCAPIPCILADLVFLSGSGKFAGWGLYVLYFLLVTSSFEILIPQNQFSSWNISSSQLVPHLLTGHDLDNFIFQNASIQGCVYSWLYWHFEAMERFIYVTSDSKSKVKLELNLKPNYQILGLVFCPILSRVSVSLPIFLPTSVLSCLFSPLPDLLPLLTFS